VIGNSRPRKKVWICNVYVGFPLVQLLPLSLIIWYITRLIYVDQLKGKVAIEAMKDMWNHVTLTTHAIYAWKGLLIKPQWNFTMQCMYAYTHISIKYYMEKDCHWLHIMFHNWILHLQKMDNVWQNRFLFMLELNKGENMLISTNPIIWFESNAILLP
jgi:hypothetical protein